MSSKDPVVIIPEKKTTIEVGDKVRVVTEYIVKRIIPQKGINSNIVLVGVEDSRSDRTITFRLDELELIND